MISNLKKQIKRWNEIYEKEVKRISENQLILIDTFLNALERYEQNLEFQNQPYSSLSNLTYDSVVDLDDIWANIEYCYEDLKKQYFLQLYQQISSDNYECSIRYILTKDKIIMGFLADDWIIRVNDELVFKVNIINEDYDAIFNIANNLLSFNDEKEYYAYFKTIEKELRREEE